MQIRYGPPPHFTDEQVRELNAQKELHRLMNDQFLLNARLNATPRFGPAVDGVLWRRIRLGEDDGEPKTPILSILEFTLKPGVDIIHNESAPS
ncbi:hypothetical protein QBC42DRAFT_92171 [Cladorrhinum samala]|uniref:Uncharacterized protein n=1 Tax=Cladorrhinum samala TaxID=585594 RepID=A0AAV9HMC7_9PEZI|nr:hypothetical protein QBC42DRAFT_92171 [Cladorrhinum samala]